MCNVILSRQELANVTGRVSSEGETVGDRDALLGLLAMGVLVLRLGKNNPAIDKKLLRQLLDLHTQVVIRIYPEYEALTEMPALRRCCQAGHATRECTGVFAMQSHLNAPQEEKQFASSS